MVEAKRNPSNIHDTDAVLISDSLCLSYPVSILFSLSPCFFLLQSGHHRLLSIRGCYFTLSPPRALSFSCPRGVANHHPLHQSPNNATDQAGMLPLFKLSANSLGVVNNKFPCGAEISCTDLWFIFTSMVN